MLARCRESCLLFGLGGVALLVGACASVEDNPVQPDGAADGASDAAPVADAPASGGPDGSLLPLDAANEDRPDAAVGTPDAAVGTPDAAVGTPDAAVGSPDATVGAPDAAVGTPDASGGMPDAAVGTPDASADRPDAALATPDAAIGTPDATQPICDPVAQTGCINDDKCTYRIDNPDPAMGHTDCFPNGTAALGQACSFSATTGVDTCQAGGYCSSGICEEICSASPNSCSTTTDTCVRTVGLFDDTGSGSCSAACDLFAQDCAGSHACYLLFTAAGAPTVCAQPNGETAGANPGVQGTDCTYLNTCAETYGCVLATSPTASQLTCAYFCDALSMGGPTCASGPGATYECRAINTFYSITGDVPANIGMCVDPAVFP